MTLSITYKNTTLIIEGNYTPKEEEITYYSDMSGYPGSPSDFEIQRIFVGHCEITDLLEEDFDKITEIVLAQLEN